MILIVSHKYEANFENFNLYNSCTLQSTIFTI